jgi:hypothetical protein
MLGCSMSRSSFGLLIFSVLFVAALSSLIRRYLPSDVEITSSPPIKSFDKVEVDEHVESKVSLLQSLPRSNQVTYSKTALKPSSTGLTLGIKVVREPSRSYKPISPEFKLSPVLGDSPLGQTRYQASDQTKSAFGDQCWSNHCTEGKDGSVLIGGLLVNQKPSFPAASTLRLGFWERFKPMFFLSIW